MAITKVFNQPPPPPDPNRNNNSNNNNYYDKPPQPNDNNNNSNKGKSGFLANKPNLRLLLVTFGFLTLLGALALGGLFFAVLSGNFGAVPTRTDLLNIQNPLASEVYATDGSVLGKFYFQNRSYVPYKQISTHIVLALVATEDERFFQHKGVDVISMGRVLVKSILLGDDAGGGSTISQQTIKNLFPRESYGALSMPVNKMREAIIAYRLENTYNKEQILSLYLNTVPFGENMYGIGSATQRFFSKKPADIHPEEAAVLVGMLKANTTYNPRLNPEKSLQRRNVVLEQMRKNKYLTDQQAASFKKLPLKLSYHRESTDDGLAPHLRERLRQEVQAYLKEHPKADGTVYNVYTDGLKIETTIDARMQQYAEEAVAEHMKNLQKKFDEHWKNQKPWGTSTDIITSSKKQSERYLHMKKTGASEATIDKAFRTKVPMKVFSWQGEVEKNITPTDSIIYYLMFLNTGFIASDPYTGEVRAYVGSINHQYFKYDYANTRRQVGSTFKPIVYATAIDQGVEPCKFYPNELRTYTNYQNWTPKNSEDEYGGYYSMKGALAKSVNTVSVEILFEAGLDNVILMAEKIGIKSKIPQMPSIALGTAEISLNNMVSSYSAFDNGGYYTPLVYLKSIKDKNGKLIADFTPKAYRARGQVMKSNTARDITEIMTEVVNNGTARRLRTEYKLTNDIAGKTGTTQSQGDGWFVGYTPTLVAGAWVGGFDQRIRFRTIAQGQGAAMALPIWGIFMAKVSKDSKYWQDNYKKFTPLTTEQQQQLQCEAFAEQIEDVYQNNEIAAQDQESVVVPVDENNNPIPQPPTNQQPRTFKPGDPRASANKTGQGTETSSPTSTVPEKPVRVKVKPQGSKPNNTNTEPTTPRERKGNFFDKMRDIFGK